MEHSGNIPIFSICGTLFWEYSPEFHREFFPNIPGIYHGNVLQIFHEHTFARWVAAKFLTLSTFFFSGKNGKLL